MIAEAHNNNRGFRANEATPCDFAFYRSDGSLLRDQTGWPSLEMIRWSFQLPEAVFCTRAGYEVSQNDIVHEHRRVVITLEEVVVDCSNGRAIRADHSLVPGE